MTKQTYSLGMAALWAVLAAMSPLLAVVGLPKISYTLLFVNAWLSGAAFAVWVRHKSDSR
jgi:spore maturation protein SpmB